MLLCSPLANFFPCYSHFSYFPHGPLFHGSLISSLHGRRLGTTTWIIGWLAGFEPNDFPGYGQPYFLTSLLSVGGSGLDFMSSQLVLRWWLRLLVCCVGCLIFSWVELLPVSSLASSMEGIFVAVVITHLLYLVSLCIPLLLSSYVDSHC